MSHYQTVAPSSHPPLALPCLLLISPSCSSFVRKIDNLEAYHSIRRRELNDGLSICSYWGQTIGKAVWPQNHGKRIINSSHQEEEEVLLRSCTKWQLLLLLHLGYRFLLLLIQDSLWRVVACLLLSWEREIRVVQSCVILFEKMIPSQLLLLLLLGVFLLHNSWRRRRRVSAECSWILPQTPNYFPFSGIARRRLLVRGLTGRMVLMRISLWVSKYNEASSSSSWYFTGAADDIATRARGGEGVLELIATFFVSGFLSLFRWYFSLEEEDFALVLLVPRKLMLLGNERRKESLAGGGGCCLLLCYWTICVFDTVCRDCSFW